MDELEILDDAPAHHFLGMQILDETGMTVRTLVCSKCRRQISRVIDEVYLCISDARFYESVRFTCCCGKPLNFRVKDFDGSGFEGDTKEILNGLGNQNKFKTQREKKKE
jgi:hypothetical protein